MPDTVAEKAAAMLDGLGWLVMSPEEIQKGVDPSEPDALPSADRGEGLSSEETPQGNAVAENEK